MTADHPFPSGYAPSWAWGWGEDQYGFFTEIKIGKVVQRMRWIPEGTFWMGSPKEEKGRDSNEGPRHEVTLTEGYWLADTPCTQALWLEVTGKNPSGFQDPERPVENVSWEAAKAFIDQINERQLGLSLGLPTEAQWERACRAGTEGATWLGDFDPGSEEGRALLDRIGWYDENSSVEIVRYRFKTSPSLWQRVKRSVGLGEIPEGEEGPDSHWQSWPVGLKEANPWGLYDMLGNVREWCEDAWDYGERYPGGSRVDPLVTDGGHRVLRGGSWFYNARRLRAAFRRGTLPPSGRNSSIGVRLSRGPHEPGEAEPQKEGRSP
ncbi:MAG: formylglycine-generating enzyme family protein [Acidobacteriota bacterium]